MLQFSFCTPTGNDMNSMNLFGEGLQWGGLSLVYLLGQGHRFEALDFVYHILNIATNDPKAASERMGSIHMAEFLESARYHRDLNNRILNLLRIHYPEVERIEPQELFGLCHPPSYDHPEGWYEDDNDALPTHTETQEDEDDVTVSIV